LRLRFRLALQPLLAPRLRPRPRLRLLLPRFDALCFEPCLRLWLRLPSWPSRRFPLHLPLVSLLLAFCSPLPLLLLPLLLLLLVLLLLLLEAALLIPFRCSSLPAFRAFAAVNCWRRPPHLPRSL